MNHIIPKTPFRKMPMLTEFVKYSTDDLPRRDRCEWLREVIGREYANVDIIPPRDGELFNEMTIFSWADLRLSAIRSNEITLERLPREPASISQDAYFVVILLSGNYSLRQSGREVFLSPGDLTLYDATLPHRVRCPEKFSKLIVSIPRTLLRQRLAGVDNCIARRICGSQGIGAIASEFIRATVGQTGRLDLNQFSALSEHALDLLTLALVSVRPMKYQLSRNRAATLYRVKQYVERNLANPGLTPVDVAAATGLSIRYINSLFHDERTSLMRYLRIRRLECCQRDLTDPLQANRRISEIAFHWGFNDTAHFSRAFKEQFGHTPSESRKLSSIDGFIGAF